MPSALPTAKTVPATSADAAGRYLALQARDARFDGRFFTGVTSTGIYCRPVCRVRTPKFENCRFFERAAQAEAAGFRPCLRCRPELAPAQSAALHWTTQDASALLALQAADLIEHATQADDSPGIVDIAARLGISDRHLRRIFEAHWGLTPLSYLQTCSTTACNPRHCARRCVPTPRPPNLEPEKVPMRRMVWRLRLQFSVSKRPIARPSTSSTC